MKIQSHGSVPSPSPVANGTNIGDINEVNRIILFLI
jgi:hypothetical protein